MKYVSGIYGLNINTNTLDTCGDWHSVCLDWNNIDIRNSKDSIFQDYGIEKDVLISSIGKTYNVANHIRSCLDLLDDGKFSTLKGMRKDFIVVDKYDKEIFNKVMMLKNNKNWKDIDDFMTKEYRLNWLKFKDGFKDEK